MPVWSLESQVSYPEELENWLSIKPENSGCVATAILFNIARMWADDAVEGEEDEDDSDSEEEDDDGLNNVVVHDAVQANVRMRGKILRDRLKDEMPP